MPAPLATSQKAHLAQLADRAFNRLAAQARGRGEEAADALVSHITAECDRVGLKSEIATLKSRPSAPTLSTLRTLFRHVHVAAASGKLGLRCCSQDDYKRVEAHFLDLLGEPGRAFNAHVRAETNSRRVVEWKIVQRCREYGIDLVKAEGICRQMTKGQSSLQEADERTLWNVFFKLRYYEPKQAA